MTVIVVHEDSGVIEYDGLAPAECIRSSMQRSIRTSQSRDSGQA